MERIKTALERAKQAQGETGSSFPSMFGDSASSSAHPADISYVQTRIVKISKRHLRDRRVISDDQHGATADAIKLLRTQVLQRLRENNWNSLAIISPNLGEGKTVLAVNLALSLAMEVNATVLLVDADLRNPGVHKLLDVPVPAGLGDYLTRDIPVSEILFHPEGMGKLVILPGNQALSNSSEMLNSPKMTNLVEELKSRYPERIVIFDLPPVLTAADALSFSPHVDATLIVTEERKTRVEDLTRAVELLAPNTNILGTVLNKSMRIQSDQPSGKKRGWLARLLGNFN